MWGLHEQIKELKADNARLKNRAKECVLALVIAFAAFSFPWRLAALCAEAAWLDPGPLHVTSDSGKFWEAAALEARLVDLGWTVSYAPDLELDGRRAYGVTRRRDHSITIDSSLAWDDRLAVLAHEGGHVLAPGWMNEEQGEVFAETVAALVARGGIREHARYLARFKTDLAVIALTEWQVIYRAAAELGY